MSSQPLIPASELASRNTVRMPNESAEYRAARNALLAEEIELRRHIERVAALRRALPPGGEVRGDSAGPGEDARGAPDLMPLWTVLDSTPEARRARWYPSLDYPG
jgi:predicted dithiol-disulfide oxidoreductase (DUF899 family)